MDIMHERHAAARVRTVACFSETLRDAATPGASVEVRVRCVDRHRLGRPMTSSMDLLRRRAIAGCASPLAACCGVAVRRRDRPLGEGLHHVAASLATKKAGGPAIHGRLRLVSCRRSSCAGAMIRTTSRYRMRQPPLPRRTRPARRYRDGYRSRPAGAVDLDHRLARNERADRRRRQRQVHDNDHGHEHRLHRRQPGRAAKTDIAIQLGTVISQLDASVDGRPSARAIESEMDGQLPGSNPVLRHRDGGGRHHRVLYAQHAGENGPQRVLAAAGTHGQVAPGLGRRGLTRGEPLGAHGCSRGRGDVSSEYYCRADAHYSLE